MARKKAKTKTQVRAPALRTKVTALATANFAEKYWRTTNALMHDVFMAMKLFKEGKMDPESARIYLGLMRTGAKTLSLNLEFARLTGQIKQGQKTLQGFGIG